MTTLNTATSEIIPPPQAKRLRAVEFRTTVGARIQLVGVDAPPTTATDEKVLDVVELPASPSTGVAFADLVAERVVERLRTIESPFKHATVPAIHVGSMPTEGRLLSVEEAAARLGVTPVALRHRCRRAQRREGREIIARLGAGVVAYKLGRSGRSSWRFKFEAT
jgi:hypothetical protein